MIVLETMRPMLRRALLVGALGMAIGIWSPMRAQDISSSADASGSSTPSASYSISMTLGSVDAVSGSINLSVPLGPTLPGRIPAGFKWTYDSMDPMQSRVGGAYLPVVWPASFDISYGIGANTRALVLGAKYEFLRAAVPTGGIPSDETFQAWMTARGVDLGSADANAYFTANGGDDSVPPMFEIVAKQPSADGTKWYIQSDWIVKIPHNRLDGTYTTYKVAKRQVVLDGGLAVWTKDGLSAEFTNRFGDHVSFVVASDPANLQTTYTLQDILNPGNTLTMVLKTGSAMSPFGSWDFQVQQANNSTLTVTNPFGLPKVVMGGLARLGQAWVYPGPGLRGASSNGERGFTPTSLTETADNGEVAATSWTWQTETSQDSKCQDPYDPTQFIECMLPSPCMYLHTINHPNGLTESITIGDGLNLSSAAFSGSLWVGYRPGIPMTQIVANEKPNPTQGSAAWRVCRTDGVTGETFLIVRKSPTISQPGGGGPYTWVNTAHETWVLKYPTSSPGSTSKYRGVHLIHPSATADIRQNASSPQAFLFATSAILAKESIHGVGGPTDLSTSSWAFPPNFDPASTSYIRDSVTVFDGWDVRSWANPSGSLSVAQPLTATPLRVKTDTDKLPSRVQIAGLPNVPGARDDWGPTQTDEYALPWSGSLSTVDPNQTASWSGTVSLPSSGVHRTGTIQRSWNSALLALQISQDHKTLQVPSGSGAARYVSSVDTSSLAVSLSPQASADFGITTNTYSTSGSTQGLLTQVSAQRGGYTATETRDYQVAGPNGLLLPLVGSVTKTLSGPNGLAPANLDDPSVKAGTDYTYTNDNFHRLASQFDKTTGTGITYDAFDSFGRVTQKTEKPLGIVTTSSYDDWGRLQTETHAYGTSKAVTTSYTYDPNGLWTRKTVTSAEGVAMTIFTELDAFARVKTIHTLKGGGTEVATQTFQYDEWGQKKAMSPVLKTGATPYGNTTYSYDDRGQLVQTTDPKGNVLSRTPTDSTGLASYPAWRTQTVDGVPLTGIWTTFTDDRGYSRGEVYDLLGQKVAVVDQNGHVSTYAYDQDGHLLQTNQGGQLRSYVYNAMGWMTQRIEPEEGLTSYPEVDPYTGAPNFNIYGLPRAAQMKGSGTGVAVTMTTTLNHFNLLATTSSTDGVITSSRSFGYDSLHRLSSFTDVQPNGTLTEIYGYDEVSRPTTKTVSDGIQSFTVSQTLDSLGRVTSLTYPSGGGRAPQLAVIDGDDQGRPSSIRLDGSLRARASYDQVSGSSDTTTIIYGNGNSTSSTLEKGDLVRTDYTALPTSGLFPTGSEANAMAWTPGGLMTDRGADHFDYDGLQRLVHSKVVGIWGEVTDQWFAYDRWGNRAAEDWTYVASGASPSSKPDEVLAYAATYDARNRLTESVAALIPGSWRGGAGQGTQNGSLLTGASYDALGRLSSIFAVPNNQAQKASSWSYDPSGRVISETVEGATSTYLLDGEGLRFKRMRSDGSIQYTVYGFNREPLTVFVKTPTVITTVQARTLAATSTTKKRLKTAQALIGGDPVGAYIDGPDVGTTLYVGQAVSFTGTSDFGYSFSWTFGDGTTATGAFPIKTYTTAGTYTVTLRVAAISGYIGSSATRSFTVAVAKPVISSFTATPTTIALGASSTLVWSVTGATSLSLDNGIGSATGTTNRAVNPSVSTTFTLSATNAGGTVTAIVTVTVVQPPTLTSFYANPANIYQGDGSTLFWTVSGATSLSLDNGIGAVSGSSRPVSPSATTTYTLTATNTLNGVSVSRTAMATVYVSPRPTVPNIDGFTADATTIAAGSGTTLRWSVSNSVGAVNVFITNVGTVAQSGSQWITPAGTTTYTLTATNSLDATKSVSRDVTVSVVNRPVITFSANPGAVNVGSSSTLNWSVTNSPTSVSIDQGIGGVGASGSTSVSPGATTTYTLTASNLAGTVTATTTVSVTQKPVIVSFQPTSSQINQGSSTTLTWTTQGATSLTVNGASVPGTSLLVSPTTTTSYTLVATNAAGTDSRTTTITVVIPESFLWNKTMIYGFGQELAEEQAGQGTVYIQSDYVGSPSILSDATGRVIGRQKALPFGERYGQSGTKSIRRYTNHEDQDGSPVYMQARMYLPTYGKFAQVDPAYDQVKDDPETWNLYNYVTNNPVTHTDPDGREASQTSTGSPGDASTNNKTIVAGPDQVVITAHDPNTGQKVVIVMTQAQYKAAGSPGVGGTVAPGAGVVAAPVGTSQAANNQMPSTKTGGGAQTKVEYAKEVPKEVKAALEAIAGYLNDGTTWKSVGGMRTPAQNKATKGAKGSDHVALKEEEGKKGAEDGHWMKDGKNVDKAVYEKIKTDGLYLGDGIQAIFHPGNSAHLEHFHLGFSDKRSDTVYTKETGPNKYTPEKRLITILGEEND
ncbi:hypothetical protein GETHED_21020 [Geothrix edaphica]|uniref:PKD domain-containing protein n=2 Tax=Geothrix edaphica TaxID=2927976 RepID=A0ABQ5PZN3_9BACT|nr:hypothetical protein GETHED_21020 [Geothrix edaphica]